ncbi:MAG: Trk system potassium transporter TrkA [Alphaproteobacteria bacterium]|nr:Trk system potassium transporter TrkA [Alphaproteobacteria bacterium]
MRVIICGAGQVGHGIASYLSREDNDITIIDIVPDRIAQINDELDVNGIVGHASNPDILNAAGASEADMIIAVTKSDEVNMVSCQVAHSLFGMPKKIARIREQSYLNPAWANMFSRSHMPIDVIISPEIVIAKDIFQRLSVPGTTYVISLAESKVFMVGVICLASCPLLNTPVGQISKLFPDLSFKILSILRNNTAMIPDPHEQLQTGDEVYFTVDAKHLRRTLAVFGHEEQKARSIVIAGGGNIGYGLVRLIRAQGHGESIKLIESREDRAHYLSEKLGDVIVLRGDGLDREILYEAGIETAETYVAVTNDDESNILSSLLAKQYGCERVITLVNNNAYSPLVGPLGVDAMISPRETIVGTIMQHVRRGRIKGLHTLRDGFAEVIEAEVSETSSIVNTRVEELVLPEEVMLGALVRGDEVLMPKDGETIRAGDIAIIMSSQRQAQTVERMFSVQVDLF